LDPWAPEPKSGLEGLLLAATELLLLEEEEQATIPREPPPITIAAIPLVTTLPRLLENII
jgi:hypothetical protein